MTRLAYAILALMLSACGALNQADTPATLLAQNAAYATEIAQLDFNATAEHDQSRARVEQLASEAAYTGGVNVQLVGTLSRVITPTPPLEGSAFDPSQSQNPDQVGQRLYVNTGMTTQIDANGCAVDPRELFSPFEPRLYATWVAYNLTEGTLFRVEWVKEDSQELMFSDLWSAPQAHAQICIWFYVTPTDLTLTAGGWQVRMFVDEVQMTAPLNFQIEASN